MRTGRVGADGVGVTASDDVLRRMADDAEFARRVERCPDEALADLDLAPGEVERIRRVIAAVHRSDPSGSTP